MQDENNGNGYGNSLNRWKNRRRMAWLSLLGIYIELYLLFFHVEVARIVAIKDIVPMSFIVLGSIIGAYVGFSTFEDVNMHRTNAEAKKKKPSPKPKQTITTEPPKS